MDFSESPKLFISQYYDDQKKQNRFQLWKIIFGYRGEDEEGNSAGPTKGT